MSDQLLNTKVLSEFLDWSQELHNGSRKLAVADLLTNLRRKIIRVANGHFDDKTEFDRLVQEFLNDSQKPTAQDEVPRCPNCRHQPHHSVCFNIQSDNDCNCTLDTLTPLEKKFCLNPEQHKSQHVSWRGQMSCLACIKEIAQKI
jgi:hypothetical protein